MSKPPKILTTHEAAKILGVTTRRVCQFCEAGRLVARKIGRDWLIVQAEAERFRRIPRPEGRPKQPGKVKGS